MPHQSVKPTESELQILAVLWQKGPATVKEVHEQLGRQTGYTTVLKFMQIMTDKGLVVREDKRGKSHVFRAALAPERMQKTLVGDLVRRAFGGSLKKLMVAALSQETSPEELHEIRRMIEEAEAKSKDEGRRMKAEND